MLNQTKQSLDNSFAGLHLIAKYCVIEEEKIYRTHRTGHPCFVAWHIMFYQIFSSIVEGFL
jgi:hypothetical protein